MTGSSRKRVNPDRAAGAISGRTGKGYASENYRGRPINRGNRLPKIAAPSANASGRVAAAPEIGCPFHQDST